MSPRHTPARQRPGSGQSPVFPAWQSAGHSRPVAGSGRRVVRMRSCRDCSTGGNESTLFRMARPSTSYWCEDCNKRTVFVPNDLNHAAKLRCRYCGSGRIKSREYASDYTRISNLYRESYDLLRREFANLPPVVKAGPLVRHKKFRPRRRRPKVNVKHKKFTRSG